MAISRRRKSKRHTHHKRHKHHSTHRRKVKRYSRRGTKRRRRKRTKRVKRGGGKQTRKIMRGGKVTTYFLGFTKTDGRIIEDAQRSTAVEPEKDSGLSLANSESVENVKKALNNIRELSGRVNNVTKTKAAKIAGVTNARSYIVTIGNTSYPILRWKNEKEKNRANLRFRDQIGNFFRTNRPVQLNESMTHAKAAPTAAAAAAPTAPAAPAPTAAAAAPTEEQKVYEKAVLYKLLIEDNIYENDAEGHKKAKIALWSNVTEHLSEEDKKAALNDANHLITKFNALPTHEKDFLKEFYKEQVKQTNNEIWNGVSTEKREADALKFHEIVRKANERDMRDEEEREEERRRPLTEDEILLNDLERKREEGVAAGEDVADIQGQIDKLEKDLESRISVSVSDRAPPPQPTPPQSPPPQSQSPPPPLSSSSSDTDEREETEETDGD